MEMSPRKIEYYRTPNGTIPYREWYYSLRDVKGQAAIRARLTRVERGLLGDARGVGEGVYELRVDLGPGYRIYFGQEGRTLVWLLCGGGQNTPKTEFKNHHPHSAAYCRQRKQ